MHTHTRNASGPHLVRTSHTCQANRHRVAASAVHLLSVTRSSLRLLLLRLLLLVSLLRNFSLLSLLSLSFASLAHFSAHFLLPLLRSASRCTLPSHSRYSAVYKQILRISMCAAGRSNSSGVFFPFSLSAFSL